MYTWNAPEDIAAMAQDEAVLAGKKARVQLELEEGEFDAVERDSIRRRLARTLVQLGAMIDPLAVSDQKDHS